MQEKGDCRGNLNTSGEKKKLILSSINSYQTQWWSDLGTQ